MDQLKIGRFIASQRKKIGLTQAQLAEKMSVSDRAVSKWENGKSLPDSSIMLELCKTLEISVTELLLGEKVKMEENSKKTEEMALEIVKQKEQNDRIYLALEFVIGILSVIVLLTPIIVGAYLPEGLIEDWQRILICLSGVLPGLIGIFSAIIIEQVAGYYECQRCGHRYVPSFKAVFFAMHMGRTRYMKCPVCKEKSWQKKVVNNRDNEHIG